MGRADLFSFSLRILGSPISLILKFEIRHIPVGAWSTHCQLEQCSWSAAPVTSPHCGPAGVEDGGTRIPSLDSPTSNYLKASLVIRTAHAPSNAPPPALALTVGRTCIFSSCRPGAEKSLRQLMDNDGPWGQNVASLRKKKSIPMHFFLGKKNVMNGRRRPRRGSDDDTTSLCRNCLKRAVGTFPGTFYKVRTGSLEGRRRTI